MNTALNCPIPAPQIWPPALPGRAIPIGTVEASRPVARRTRELQSEASIVNLADVLEMAVALNQNAARNRNVRVHSYCLDQLPVREQEYELLDVLDGLVGSAVQDALWGSLVVCEASLADGQVMVRVRYARPPSCSCAGTWAIAWTETVRTWRVDSGDRRGYAGQRVSSAP